MGRGFKLCHRALSYWVIWQAMLSDAQAQEFGAKARVESTPVIDETATVTSVNARTMPKALATTHDLLLEVPGVRPVSFGGWSQYTVLTLRGADAEHTQVFLGEIPLSAPDGGAVDLSTLPPFLIERIDVFRGGAPVWLGSGSIGGVVRVVPREQDAEMAVLQTGVASYGTFNTQGSVSLKSQWLHNDRLQIAAGMLRSEGGFLYRDNMGTPLDPTDDVEATQRNGQLRSGYGLMRYRADLGGHQLEWLNTAFVRQAPALRSYENVHTFFARFLSGLSLSRQSAKTDALGEALWRYQGVATYALERRRFFDPYNSVGLGAQETDDSLHRVFVRAAGSRRMSSWFRWTALSTWTADIFSPYNALSEIESNENFHRHALAGALEGQIDHTLGHVPMEWRLSGRAEAMFNAFPDQSTASEIAPTMRLSHRSKLSRLTNLQASFARGVRFPSMLELFGDRGFTEGNTSLTPETSWMADIGIVQRIGSEATHLNIESRFFVQKFSDLIRYIRTSQRTAKPENVASASNLGIELGIKGRAKMGSNSSADIVGQLTWQHPRDAEGRILPYRPLWQMYLRPAINWKNYSVYADVSHLGQNYQDAANVVMLGPRTLVGCGGSIFLTNRRVEFTVSVRDLFDVQPYEVVGFPLPGRTIAAGLTLRSE